MAIRFTEYLRHDERELALYIVQENIDVDKIGFKVFIKGEDNIVFALYKEGNTPWVLLPQFVPPIVNEIKNKVIRKLENQMTRQGIELRYFKLNDAS